MSRKVNLAVSLILNGTSFCDSESVYEVNAAYYGVFSAIPLTSFLAQHASTAAVVLPSTL